MRVIFAGTPEFARVALERLHASGHTIALVLSQPDRPAGRGMKLQASAVKQFAVEHGIPVAQPRSLRLDGKYPEDAAAARQAIADAQADVMVVAAYGLILPQWVLDDMAPTLPAARGSLPPEGALAPRGGPSALVATQPKFGCLNIHGSLLPRWRGAAPIHRAIEAGDTETGVTIMQMDAGLDTGDMLLVHSMDILPTDTTATLHDRMAALGGDLIVMALDMAAAGRLEPVPQPAAGVTYAHKIEKHEAAIDWRLDAASIVRRVRAFNPFPGATATLNGEVIKVWGAHAVDGPTTQAPGSIVAVAPVGIEVAAMQSIVNLTELQRPGGKRLAVADFLRGFGVQVGQQFELLATNTTPPPTSA
ncbi:methionyl-tRNA formyltransferase [Rhodoferax sp. AJA081-3]|uniref:methionyl-tRNA formyltransferase n=1 Tax=Rhodoferax sp. AJA081-3 TaxID=2752316 RepID=UPI001AE01E2F|nr:methionyl-tRNA formyltransferase [Rhodoferax sp. AJA081-3]QTN26792.1 methionyl-tRNA formyltransferase [Rhodoferax sp. AJA081-3]